MDTGFSVFLVFFVVLAVGALISGLSMGEKQGRFVKLGNITGMSKDKIISAVGPPNSISQQLDGTLLQWIEVSSSGSYHYAILFDNDDNAVGYTHQSSH